ncbi:MAG: DUF3604 domain-containing protein [Rhodospirillaceae bacterium]|nr:MAG: DUF3604 domain-containing protein [Rhodospirillaceae bacterium]
MDMRKSKISGKVSLLAAAAYFSALTGGGFALAADPTATAVAAIPANPLRNAYYGDLHLHTTYSFDAYVLMGTKADPETAYRFGRGEPVEYLGQMVQRGEPLDFLAVTDHAENMGVFNQLEDPNSVVSKSELGKALKDATSGAHNPRDLVEATKRFFALREQKLPPELQAVSASAWDREVSMANRYYQPGKFTTFIGYEWTSMPGGANLHRNVIFKGDAAPAPFTSMDSSDPEDLWAWLEKIRKQGYEAIAIPHNGNASNGLMYDWTTLDGRPIDRAYAELRQANEPLSEMSQNKGSSETHPLLSPNDEFANYEIFDHLLAATVAPSKPQGSYVRDALSRGLVLQRIIGVNPYKFGVEGGSDLHGALSVSSQADYAGNMAGANLGGGRPTKEQAAGILGTAGNMPGSLTPMITTAGNLTGVWAESNTRESIYNALRRKETFATTGTKLKVRFFGGWNLDKTLVKQGDWVKAAYDVAVPMGGDLPANTNRATAPSFAVWAVKDPNAGNLDRIQVIKVWEENNHQKEKIFDVAWSGHRKPDAKTGKLPAVGTTVDLHTGKYTNTIGAAELKTVWTDPEFDPERLAAYYLRVLEIPTPRWSTLLAVQNGLPIPKGFDATEQQRAWSSPIWYTPK